MHHLAGHQHRNGLAVALQLRHQSLLALGLRGAFVVQNPPARQGVIGLDGAALHQPVNAQALALVMQRGFVDGGLDQRRALQADDALAGWWVLDYKSATQPQRQQALVAQLQRYREAVSVLMPGEVVHAAFLTGDGRMVMAGGAEASAALGHTPAPGVAAVDVPALSAAPAARPGAAKAAPTVPDSRQGSLF